MLGDRVMQIVEVEQSLWGTADVRVRWRHEDGTTGVDSYRRLSRREMEQLLEDLGITQRVDMNRCFP